MPRTLDKRTLDLLTSSTPNLFGKGYKTADPESANLVVDRTRRIVVAYGNPRFELLDSGTNQDKLLGSDEERNNVVSDRTPSNQSYEATMSTLTDWIKESPLRILEVPFMNSFFYLRLDNLKVEADIYQRLILPGLSSATEHPLSDLREEDCVLSFRSDTWFHKGKPFWFSFYNPRVIKEPVIDCLEAILIIFETQEIIRQQRDRLLSLNFMFPRFGGSKDKSNRWC